MEKRKREILALCLLVFLGVIVAGAMAWYMMVGHSWNKAASHIDDLVGSMEGYTVIVYEGTLSHPKASKGSSKSLSSSSASASPSTPASASSPVSASASASESASASASASSSASASAQASSSAAAPSATSAPVDSEPSASFSSSARVAVEADAVDLKKVIDSYREKGACVIRLHVSDLDRYSEPLVFSQSGRRFGVCAAPGKYRYVTVRDKVLELKKAQADFTVVLANKPGITKGWLRDVDLVILSCDAHIPSNGDRIGGTFFVDAAPKDQVQAVIISPSGTITTKTITSL